MPSLQTLANSQRTEEEVRSKPRTIVIAHERSLGTLPIRSDDARLLIREGLLYECHQHDLHLVERLEWAHDDVEHLMVAVSRGFKSSIPVFNGAGPNVHELRKRIQPVYEPPPTFPLDEPETKPATWKAGALIIAAFIVWTLSVGAYFYFSQTN